MKNQNRTTISMAAVSAVLMTALPLSSFAIEREGRSTQIERLEQQKAAAPAVVKWVGTIGDSSESHTTEHKHDLRFTRKDTGESYCIEGSSELLKLHHETERNYVVEIEAEKKPKFLFWGGKLKVKTFKVIEEASDRIPHGEPAALRVPSKLSIGRHSI